MENSTPPFAPTEFSSPSPLAALRAQLPLIALAAVVVIAVSGGVGYLIGQRQAQSDQPSPSTRPITMSPAPENILPGEGEGVMCTMDAMQCPDGSFVGRTGPNCEFVCPGGNTSDKNAPESSIPTFTAPQTWKTLQEAGYTIKYPADFELTQQEVGQVLTKFGPTQVTETEFFDAVSITIDSDPLPAGENLKTVVEAKMKKESLNGVTVHPHQPVTIADYTGYTFITEGMGSYTNYYLENKDQSRVVTFFIFSEDPTNQGFETVVQQILGTLVIK